MSTTKHVSTRWADPYNVKTKALCYFTLSQCGYARNSKIEVAQWRPDGFVSPAKGKVESFASPAE